MLHLEINVKRRHIYGLVAAIAMIVAAMPVASWASHQFNDVPDSNIFHSDIAWLADADVTKGCNPPDNDEFCPSSNVTRETMAAFMRRLAENQVVDAKTAITAETADEAVEADRVDGLHGWMLHNTAWSYVDDGSVSVPGAADTNVGTLDFSLAAAGDVLVHAEGAVYTVSTGAYIDAWIQIDDTTCVDDSASALVDTFAFTQSGSGDVENFSMQRVASNVSAGVAHTATLCVNDYSGFGGNPDIYRPSLTATYVHTAPVTVAGVSGSEATDPGE